MFAPIVSLTRIAMEPVFGNISLGLFINLAEASGAIHELGDWVLDRCLRDMNNIKKSDLPLLKVVNNVSPPNSYINRSFLKTLKPLLPSIL